MVCLTSKFLKGVFHKFHLVHYWILCPKLLPTLKVTTRAPSGPGDTQPIKKIQIRDQILFIGASRKKKNNPLFICFKIYLFTLKAVQIQIKHFLKWIKSPHILYSKIY